MPCPFFVILRLKRSDMTMKTIPRAKASPRMENGVIRWYEGDTFRLTLILNLKMLSEESYPIGEGDSVTVNTYDDIKNLVESINFDKIENNSVVIDFDSVRTAKYPKGKYRYDVIFKSNYITTVADKNDFIVE